MNRTLETDSSPGESCYCESTCLSVGFPLEKQPRLEVKPVSLFLTSISMQLRSQRWTRSSPPYPGTKTHSSGLFLCTIPRAFPLFAYMTCLRTDTESGFKGTNGDNFLQHVYQRAAAAACRCLLCLEQQSSAVYQSGEGEQRKEGWHCPSLHLLLHLWLSSVISRGITKKKKKVHRKYVRDVSGERSPLV